MFHRDPQRDQVPAAHQQVAHRIRGKPQLGPHLVRLPPAAADGHLVPLRGGLHVRPGEARHVKPEPVPFGIHFRGQHFPVEFFLPLFHLRPDGQRQVFQHLLLVVAGA